MRVRRRFSRRLGVLAFTVGAAFAVPGPAVAGVVELAAREAEGAPTIRPSTDSPVRRVQQSLRDLGFYRGPIDGRLTPATERAIRRFQQQSGLTETGRIDDELLAGLAHSLRVDALLNRLRITRDADIADARQKLLDSETTRHLMDGAGARRADPTRDPAQCLAAPTIRCLLSEAVESAEAIPRDELRNWAFGEILVAQARAGLSDDAIATVRRIDDPRLIMVALRDIAQAQAEAGRFDTALEAATNIPDPALRLEALSAVAERQAAAGVDPAVALDRLLAALDSLDDTVKQVAFRAQAAVIAATAGDRETAGRLLDEAERLARAKVTGGDGGASLRHVASALAEMERPGRALAVLQDVRDRSNRVPVLVSAATAQARAGRAREAKATAAGIDEERYRAVVLGHIAVAQAAAGDGAAARGTVAEALDVSRAIRFPYARAYAISRVAYAAIEIAKASGGGHALGESVDVANRIEDDRLRAEVLWSIAAERRRSGDLRGATDTEVLAESATDAIKSALSRVWLFGDLADRYLAAGDRKAARVVFERGLAIAGDIKNAWGRARAVSRMAVTLIDIDSMDRAGR